MLSWKIVVAYGVGIGVVAFALGSVSERNKWQKAKTRDSLAAVEAIRKADDELDSLRIELARAREKFEVDTIELVKYRDRWKTLRDTLRLTDSVQVYRFVYLTDSTLSSCNASVESCKRVASLLAEDTVRLRRQRDSVISLRTRDARKPVLSCGPGVHVAAEELVNGVKATVASRISFSCNYPIFQIRR